MASCLNRIIVQLPRGASSHFVNRATTATIQRAAAYSSISSASDPFPISDSSSSCSPHSYRRLAISLTTLSIRSKASQATTNNNNNSRTPSLIHHDHKQLSAPFHTHNHPELYNDHRKPGSIAFGECEISALSDLFLQFAKTKHTVDDIGPYLNLEGIRQLLASVGEKPDESTLKTLFHSINVHKDGKLRLDCFLRAADQVLGDSPARIVLVVGGPGSGKGALCSRLEEECGAVHISCGELLRSEVEAGTPLGREVSSIMEAGGLVSSAVVTALMRRRMRHHPGRRILLDGFPRSLENARDFVELCGPPELALHLDCDDTILVERTLALSAKSGGVTKVDLDANVDTAIQRLRNYHKHHRPTMDWLKSVKVPIVELDCSGSKEDVWQQLVGIGRLMRPAVKIPSSAMGMKMGQQSSGDEDMQWFG